MTRSTPPILFLVFNRPDKTRQVFERIRAAKPARLYVAADGPRADRPHEAAICAETRSIAESVDWPCEVRTLFREHNLGCRRAVSGGIDWFFENEEEGIIFEDDIEVDPSFFPFAADMLERYRDEPRVMSITACNMQPEDRRYQHSYYFSAYNHVWGWASWRRAWAKYDHTLDSLETPATWHAISAMGGGLPWFENHWLTLLRQVRDGKIDTWDYSWLYTQWMHEALTVTPRVCMMRNIGFDETATHTKKSDTFEAGLRAHEMRFPLVHPERIVRETECDEHIARNVLRIRKPNALRRLKQKLRGA